jgi:hypothetical protein
MAKDAPTKKKDASNTGRHNARAGRYLGAEARGRYTKPIPRNQRRSPRWYGPAVLSVLLLGVLTIALNYANALPGGTSRWYLLAGVAILFSGFMAMLRYH